MRFDPTDTGHAGAFIRRDGSRFLVHLGEDSSGNEGWYWSEAVKVGWAEYEANRTCQGRNGVGPFNTCREACHNALETNR